MSASVTIADDVDAFIRQIPLVDGPGELHPTQDVLMLALERAVWLRVFLKDPAIPPIEPQSATEFFEHWMIAQWRTAFGWIEEARARGDAAGT